MGLFNWFKRRSFQVLIYRRNFVVRYMKSSTFELGPLRDRSLFTGGGRATIFSKSGWKKIWPSPSAWQKNYDPPPATGEKNCDPPPISFFYFHLIFFNKNNIFYKKMCSLQQLFCIFWKSWKVVFLHSQAKEADHSQPFVLYVFDDIFWPVFSSEGPSWSIES